MHPYTVYGIETNKRFRLLIVVTVIACTLIPFTVLKPDIWRYVKLFVFSIACTLIPFTVLKLRSHSASMQMLRCAIACTLIPFTVLKHSIDLTIISNSRNCMHPYTVYGIETQSLKVPVTIVSVIACTLIPFTVLKHAIGRVSD